MVRSKNWKLGGIAWNQSKAYILFNSMEGVGGQLFLSALDQIHFAFGCFRREFLKTTKSNVRTGKVLTRLFGSCQNTATLDHEG